MRDFLQIFVRCVQKAIRDDANRITVPIVTAAAQEWYENDKQQNLSDVQQGLLRALITEVIGNRKARSFMVARELSASEILQSLIDQRVVHIIRKGYADKDNPGVRYNIYTLDYGCYVDLKGTSREPRAEYVLESDDEYSVVPFDDNRSIRRIIVPAEILDETRPRQGALSI